MDGAGGCCFVGSLLVVQLRDEGLSGGGDRAKDGWESFGEGGCRSGEPGHFAWFVWYRCTLDRYIELNPGYLVRAAKQSHRAHAAADDYLDSKGSQGFDNGSTIPANIWINIQPLYLQQNNGTQ